MQPIDKRHIVADDLGHRLEKMARLDHDLDGLLGVARHGVRTIYGEASDEIDELHRAAGRFVGEGLALGLPTGRDSSDWLELFKSLAHYGAMFQDRIADRTILRLKQWMKFAKLFGEFPLFDDLKLCGTTQELLTRLAESQLRKPEDRVLVLNQPLI